jgi:NitT/TauT family transport system substrate-binding protein
MQRRTLMTAAAASLASMTLRAFAVQRTRILYGYTAAADFASVFVAADQGFFGKRGLDVELKLVPLGSTIPAALESDSLQIAGPTPSAVLSAVEGGLDLVVIAGGTVSSSSSTELGVVARTGSDIHKAQDFIGKKVGVPGLGSALHVTFRAWLMANGVDFRKLNYVEASFPQHGDLLRAGTLDAVVTVEPFLSRIVDSGVGYVASYYTDHLPPGQQKLLHVAKRDWVQKNLPAARAFRESVVESAAFMKRPENDAAVRAAIGKYIKLPPPVLAKIAISTPDPMVTETQLKEWEVMMDAQGMLKSKMDLASLIVR